MCMNASEGTAGSSSAVRRTQARVLGVTQPLQAVLMPRFVRAACFGDMGSYGSIWKVGAAVLLDETAGKHGTVRAVAVC